MTPEETRQLGIEFERRVQTMIPEKEYLDKLDTDTIYAYLNSYQDKYIHEIYRNLDQIKSGSKLSAHVESVLQEMLRTQTISVEQAKDNTQDITDDNGVVIIENGRSVTYPLDPSFYMYVRSVSSVSSTYSFKNKDSKTQPIRVLPNELVSQPDVWRLLETPHNSLRILRYPVATIGAYEEFVVKHDPIYLVRLHTGQNMSPLVEGKKYTMKQLKANINLLCQFYDIDPITIAYDEFPTTAAEGDYDLDLGNLTITIYVSNTDTDPVIEALPTLNVIYDRYTNPIGIKIIYYAQPQRFSPMTSKVCELPMDAFDDLVTGAVDLYVQYVAGAEANKRRIQEAQKQQAKQNKKDNEDED